MPTSSIKWTLRMRVYSPIGADPHTEDADVRSASARARLLLLHLNNWTLFERIQSFSCVVVGPINLVTKRLVLGEQGILHSGESSGTHHGEPNEASRRAQQGIGACVKFDTTATFKPLDSVQRNPNALPFHGSIRRALRRRGNLFTDVEAKKQAGIEH
ncbi:hypothetical protein PCANC_21113 [Puccinia coronata f. sp. avenae]|uniref:Uncharacterized protein n=1 Tax=Puccinia coronata f. sp. avenae TaxID=200324 RepID=A0A2N5RY16_9BASI|nr:hypothetical protein PCANC_27125 [Puccinia coronata f. sp. avenae]PLW29682.1 hypothetical protein PCANC_21113 [Puccinia coronata f. sp. avenae]PLW35238.1 hypothetical protein PCASD_08615 [Puccinia coronata f. sp. avenae]